MVAVVFTSGTMLRARTWAGLERRLREQAWNSDFKKDPLREEMLRRAWNWSLFEGHWPSSSRDLFRQLEAAGLLRITEDEEER